MRDAAIVAVLSIAVSASVLVASSAFAANTQQYPLPHLEKANVKIMVLGYSGSFVANNVILRITPADAECELFRLDEVKNLNLTKYDIILVLSHVFDFENNPDPLSISKIRNYVNQGGYLVSLLQFTYDWLNSSLGFERKLVTSLAVGNISDPFYEELQWRLNGNALSRFEIGSQIEALKASVVENEGFFYPAYGVFSNYSGSPLILDSVSREPVLIKTRIGLGTVVVSTCAWDYHLSRSDIPRQTMSGENLLLYHVLLYGVMNKLPIAGLPTTILLVGVIAVVVAAALVVLMRRKAPSARVEVLPVRCVALPAEHSDEIPRSRLPHWLPVVLAMLFVVIVASVGSSLLNLINSNVEGLHTRLYQIDRDLDGFPDQGTSIMELDDVFLTLGRSSNAVFGQTGVTLITIIASVFYMIGTYLISRPVGSKGSTSWWSSLWKYVFLVVSVALLILLALFAIIGLNPA